MSTVVLRDEYEVEAWDTEPDFDAWLTAARRRSVRMSMGRALRQLEATGQIRRNKAGEWYPAKDWTARDVVERQRLGTAFHEAGHAVIGLALKLPIAFVTIKPRQSTRGYVDQAPLQRRIGEVYARGSYRKPIADISEQDAFGNPMSGRDVDWHADIVMSIAGGMAEAEFMRGRGGHTSPLLAWRRLEGTRTDRRIIASHRRDLGNKARSVEEYEVECEKLIKRHWLMIEAVAAKLLTEETLSGSDVYAICWRIARNVVRRQHLKPIKP